MVRLDGAVDKQDWNSVNYRVNAPAGGTDYTGRCEAKRLKAGWTGQQVKHLLNRLD